ncbi:oligosaccharide flippase family protein [Providencia huaxiensis]|uniref:oligosaccharide flippase family protein n=1 Tax=Providencia TaxID=586 RepID=UPI002554F5F5|nr:oligosaccharide flippase family protein [Providencia rettgeri]
MKKDRKNVIINIAALIITQLFNYLSLLIVFPYLSRVLSLESFGQFGISLSIILILNIIIDFGFNISSPKWISIKRNNYNFIGKYIASIFIIKSIIFIIFSSLFFILINLTNISNFSIPLQLQIAIVVCVFFQSAQLTFFFQGIEKMKKITSYAILSKIFFALAVFIFVKKDTSISFIIMLLGLSYIISFTIGLFYFHNEKYRLKLPSINILIFSFKDSLMFFLSRASVSIYTSASTIIIGNYSSLNQAALYSASEKIYNAGQGILYPISQALYPYLSKNKDAKYFFYMLFSLVTVLVIAVMVISFFTPILLSVFYGKEYEEAYPIMNIFLCILVINFLSSNFGYPAFTLINRLDIANKTVIIGGFLQLILLTLIYNYSYITAFTVVSSVLITELFVLCSRVTIFVYLYRLQKSNTFY